MTGRMTNIGDMPTAQQIQELREKTGCGIMDCKLALVEANDDAEKAVEILRKKGVKLAAKKADRAAGEGLIESYIHPGAHVGVLVHLACETDFVARNQDFKILAHDLALQVASMHPLYVSFDEVPADVVAKEKEIAAESARAEGKPENIIEKIIEGRLQKLASEVCLLNQPFFKDAKRMVGDIVTDAIAKLGENIQVKRFVRFSI